MFIEDEEFENIANKIEQIRASHEKFNQKDMLELIVLSASSSLLAFFLLGITNYLFSPTNPFSDIIFDIPKIIAVLAIFFAIGLIIPYMALVFYFFLHELIKAHIKKSEIKIELFDIHKDVINDVAPEIWCLKQDINRLIGHRTMWSEEERDKVMTYSFISLLSGFIFFLLYHYLYFLDPFTKMTIAGLIIVFIIIFVSLMGKEIHYVFKNITTFFS